MLLWFTALGAAGLVEVVAQPGILRGLSPSYAVQFAADRPAVALVAMGAVVPAVTGPKRSTPTWATSAAGPSGMPGSCWSSPP
jgi:K+ transporter